MLKSEKKEIGGRSLSIETGKLARQADGAVTVRYGDTIVLVTVVTKELKEDLGFLPLTVDYREKVFAVGRIPGGFFKREGRPTTKEILTMRLIDRSIRPIFPKDYRHEVQIISFVLSADQQNDPDVAAIIGASAAIQMAGIPIKSAIASVRVGCIDNEFVINPTYEQLETSSLNLAISGSQEAIIMVEGAAKEIPENILLDAIHWGHEHIKSILPMQQALPIPRVADCEIVEVPTVEANFHRQLRENFHKEIASKLQANNKKQRERQLDQLYEKIQKHFFPNGIENREEENALKNAFEKNQKAIVRQWIAEGKRIDGRNLKEVRPIQCEASLLPRTHGSGLFTRGETQALVTATLGTQMDEQVIEGLMAESSKKRFMLHYNFPPFCVGEVRFLRSPSRREIGHGNLAERALESILPDEKRFPYTIRIVSEILESNGSSSMASICGATLALMDAGVPIKRPVAGIAMGLVEENNSIYVLSDIMGTEDHYGDMDFKVAGTQRGVTALQMDIKTQGISRTILERALKQAREGRIHILREMMTVLDRPRRSISDYAPKIFQLKIPADKISAIIGPGGKTIRSIQERSGATIDIKDDGIVTIYCKSNKGAMSAKEMVMGLTEEAKVGEVYKGKVTSVKDFGAFVEIMPGLEGLVHVSELEKNYVQNVGDVVKVGDEISVKVLAIDDQNRIKLSKRAADRRERSKHRGKQ